MSRPATLITVVMSPEGTVLMLYVVWLVKQARKRLIDLLVVSAV